MGEDFYWLNHDIKRKVYIGRHFDQERYEESVKALNKLFEFINYDEDFDDFGELLNHKRVPDLLFSDLIKISNYLLLLKAIKTLNEQDVLVYHLNKIIGQGDVAGDYNTLKTHFINEYPYFVEEKPNSGGKRILR